ncbi:MAG: CapA family protein [Eubacterium sp.]|nr:CapA family protein [Eubacterium sp.]
MKKFLIVLLLLLGCCGTGYIGYKLAMNRVTTPVTSYHSPNEFDSPVHSNTSVSGSSVDSSDDEEDEDEPEKEITFAACGDNLINSYLYSQARQRSKKGKYDFKYCYKSVADFFKKTDLNWINQETLVTDGIEPKSYPRFASPGDVARDLYKINFRVFNISTNHTYDQKAKGLSLTQKLWKSMPDDTLAVGLVKNSNYKDIPIKKVNGIKFAFLSYTYGTNGLPTPKGSKSRVIFLSETEIIKKQVKRAHREADVVIVSCHWGDEDRHEINSSQRQMAKDLTGWGADLIIGTHPHVVQDAEWVKNKGRKAFCAYSLGNFLSGQSKSDNLIGAVLSLKFAASHDKDGDMKVEIKDPKLIPAVTEYRSGHQNIHVVWLKDYSKKSADTHGVRGAGGYKFDYDYIFDVLKDNINRKYLDLPKKKKK